MLLLAASNDTVLRQASQWIGREVAPAARFAKNAKNMLLPHVLSHPDQ